MTPCRVSLILTTYNSEDNLPDTLKSIEEQDYPDIEVIIKDGGSTDNTLNIIEEFAARHKGSNSQASDILQDNISVKLSVNSDTGIYDAMNQGIQLSTGDIIACFNDRFTCANAVSRYVTAMNETTPDGNRYDAVHSDLVYSDGDRVVRTWQMGPGGAADLKRGWMPGHPTLYLRRDVYDRYGLYKTDYKIAADYEFMVRIIRDGSLRLNYIPQSLISMYYGGTSSSSLGSYIRSFLEGWRALRENNIPFALMITIKRTIKVLLQF